MIAIIDYGVGNLFSLKSSLSSIGASAIVSRDPDTIHEADALILPGVGAFGDAAEKLEETGMKQVVLKEAAAGKPLLGICLGMQLLFDSSTEFGMHEGLGLIHGQVDAIEPKLTRKLDIPHIGWNQLHFVKDSELFDGIPEGTYVYFVHSYAAFHCEEHLIAETEYEIPLTAAAAEGNVYGTQFHPEKSGPMGLRILKNFCRIAGENV